MDNYVVIVMFSGLIISMVLLLTCFIRGLKRDLYTLPRSLRIFGTLLILASYFMYLKLFSVYDVIPNTLLFISIVLNLSGLIILLFVASHGVVVTEEGISLRGIGLGGFLDYNKIVSIDTSSNPLFIKIEMSDQKKFYICKWIEDFDYILDNIKDQKFVSVF
ncbi:MAG: hypothetical protein ACRCVT_05835 [Leadbetterella sp.]